MNIRHILGRTLAKLRQREEAPVAAAVSSDTTCVAEQPVETVRYSPYPFPPQYSDDYESGWFRAETGELFTGFPINAEDAVLDIGCGDGVFVHFCAERGAEVFFADVDAAKIGALAQALRNSPARAIHPIVTDANPIPLDTASMDKIIAREVLEHLDDPVQFMRELVRIGKPGALYLLSVPDPLMEGVQEKLAPPSYFQKPNHIKVFGRDEFEQLVTDAGLTLERRTSYGFYWSVWWSFFWVCKQDLAPPWHPLLESWTKTWELLLTMPEGARIKQALDATLPKSQIIIARKPVG